MPKPNIRQKKTNSISAKNISKTVSNKEQSFNIQAKTNGNAKLTYSSNNKAIKVNSNGKVTVSKNYIGKATITIKAAETGKYNGTCKKITVTIRPKGTSLSSISNPESEKIQVKWKKLSGITGYQIQYATQNDFKNGKVKTVKNADNTKLSGLTKGKIYYIRIRTYKKVGEDNIYSQWSDTKSIHVTH